ncbi:MAG: hypothetical protein QW783_04235 [Candidatus Micrarchaeia archaeon]
MEYKERQKSGITMTVTKSTLKPTFKLDGKSEPIMVVKKGQEEIRVRIGDTVKIGPGIYRIVEYIPTKEWKNEIAGSNFNASVKCKLIGGRLFRDLKRVAYYDRSTNETFIELTPETLSYFVISIQEKAEIIQKKREELARKLNELQKKRQEDVQAEAVEQEKNPDNGDTKS